MNWKLRKAFTGNNTSDVQTINGYIAAGEDNDFSVEVSPVGKEYPAPLVVSINDFGRPQNQVPGICNGIHTHTGAASGGGIAATTLTGTGSGGKFKYEFDTLGKLTLIEAMTHENLLLQSNQFDTTWLNQLGGTITNGEAGYDGTNDAWLISKGTGTFKSVRQAIVWNGISTFSVYAKEGSLSNAALRMDTGGGAIQILYDLTDGSITSTSGTYLNAGANDIGNGWYRLYVSANVSSGSNVHIYADRDGTTAGNIYIQDAQLESGSQATGYIETTTAPVREGAGQGYKVDDKLSITTNEGHDIEFRLVEGSNATTVTVGMEATKPSKPVPFPVTKMRVADSTDRQVLIMDQRSRYVFPKPTPYLLDSYEGAAAAYSLRRLRSAYTGPAVRVRRESNNDELDIYFDGQGNLDTASLEAFCAGTDGFVKVWYDQSGNGNDVTQDAATANQPKIISSGSIIPEGGKPALEFDGSSDRFPFDSTGLDIGNLSSFLVMKANVATGLQNGLILSGAVNNKRWYAPWLYSGDFNYSYATQLYAVATTANTENNLHTAIAGTTQGNWQAFLNGNSLGSQTLQTGIDTSYTDGIGALNGANFFNGLMQEIVVYGSDQSSNRTGIETNINDYYNIY
jgi:hypothetical protein